MSANQKSPGVEVRPWPGQAAGLTVRQSEVLTLIARGADNNDIARELFIGMNTLKTCIRVTYRALGITSRSRAVLWAIENGFRPDLTGPIELRTTERMSGNPTADGGVVREFLSHHPTNGTEES